MKKIALLQSNYIPWKGYFDIIKSVDIFVIYDDVQFTKNDWRNRNQIITKEGLSWITIPVKHNFLNQKISETYTVNDIWKKKHINTLTVNYGRAPFFKTYKEELFYLYSICDNNLSNINFLFIKYICKCLDINTEIIYSKDLDLVGNRSEKIIDACIKLGATSYFTGPSANNYLDSSLFENNNVSVEWMDYSRYLPYKQLSNDFTHFVSILDLLFMEGPNSIKYLL